MVAQKAITLGVIVGNRGFFPGHICEESRKRIIKVLKKEEIKVVALSSDDTQYGAVESIEDARILANLFAANRKEIDGILITLPNFGDERAIANTIRWSELNVPVFVHAFPDDTSNMSLSERRDSFCGKISVCNNLRQYGIKFSLPTAHTSQPENEDFLNDLRNFISVCRIVRGLKGARIGVIGARTSAFNTVRYSEKLFERSGISVETADLSEIIGRATRLSNEDPSVVEKVKAIKNYASNQKGMWDHLVKMAKFGVVIDNWIKENQLVATAIQCWTALQENYGIVPCTLMSMMSNNLIPSACETDVAGTIAMYVLSLATGTPSAIVDWNNNFDGNPDKGVVFHCSNLPCDILANQENGKDLKTPVISHHDILSTVMNKEKTYGTIIGRIKSSPFTFLRISTDDCAGKIKGYLGQGAMTGDKIETFGGYGVIEVSNLQNLLHFICENGFEHHVSINLTETADAVNEALSKYMKWDIFLHE